MLQLIHKKTHKHIDLSKPGICTISLCVQRWLGKTIRTVDIDFEGELEPVHLHNVTPDDLSTLFDAPTKLELRRRAMNLKTS